jgi:hypothetical protein
MEKYFLFDVSFRRKVILCAEKIGNCAGGINFLSSISLHCAHAQGFVG